MQGRHGSSRGTRRSTSSRTWCMAASQSQPRIGRSGLAHRHVVPARPAESEHALRARSAAARGDTSFCSIMPRGTSCRTGCRNASKGFGEARRHLQQRRLHRARGSRRPTIRAPRPHVSPARLRPSGNSRGASISPAAPCLHRGVSLDDSSALLDEIWNAATREPLTGVTVRVGDVVLWDNRCTMHRRDASVRQPVRDATVRRSRLIAGPRPPPSRSEHAATRVDETLDGVSFGAWKQW